MKLIGTTPFQLLTSSYALSRVTLHRTRYGKSSTTPKKYTFHILPLPRVILVIGIELLQVLDILLTTQEDWASTVNRSGDNVEDTLRAGSGNTTSLLSEERHGEGLVKHSQFTILALLVIRVAKDTAIQQRSVNIGNHGTNVPRRVGLAILGILDAVEVVVGRGVEMQRVSFVERIDLASRGDFDSRVGKDKFSEGLEENVSNNFRGQELKDLLTSSRVKPSTPLPVDKTRLHEEPYIV